MKLAIVTGAAGTIGSAVCRKLVDMEVNVVGFDIAETPLFYLEEELGPSLYFEAAIGDVRSFDLLRLAMARRPDVIIHAAALKHVGMCQRHVAQAVLTNVQGTLRATQAAQGVRARLVVVSTDKAVRPINVMGMTKKVAERVAFLYRDSTVARLVNVSGSQGSLLPLIAKRLERGEPIQLTDRSMTRSFMEAEDAAMLIIAAAQGEAGKVYLPMDVREVRIIDLITAVCDAHEAKTGRRYVIQEIGARPGEKLMELLHDEDEHPEQVAPYAVAFDGRAPGGKTMIEVERLLAEAIAGREVVSVLQEVANG